MSILEYTYTATVCTHIQLQLLYVCIHTICTQGSLSYRSSIVDLSSVVQQHLDHFR